MSNWRSLYSLISWSNRAQKKVWKPTSSMTFFMFGDNTSHLPFNIWRLPRLLRFCKTKFNQSLRCSQNTMSQNTHSKTPTNKIRPLKILAKPQRPFHKLKSNDIPTISTINPKILHLHKSIQQWLKPTKKSHAQHQK